MLDGNFRKSVETVTLPTGRWLVRIGFSADVLTFSGLVFSFATAWMIALGHFWIAIVLLTLTGFHDLFDGPVAKASKRASQRGAFFDSVMDRVADSLVLGGVAFYLTEHQHGQLVLLPFAILTTTYLISYQRSKAESLGLAAKGGLMERAERMILLGIGLIAKPIFVPVLWILLVLISFTAISRFVKVWNAASGRDAVIRRRIEAWREGRVDSRWRAWRESRESIGVPRRELARTTGRRRARARRQETVSSRSGRTLRERRRATRGQHAGGTSARRTARRTPPAA